MHKKVLLFVVAAYSMISLEIAFFFLEYIQYHLIDWRLLKFRLPVNEHGCLLTQSQLSILENKKLNLLTVIDCVETMKCL